MTPKHSPSCVETEPSLFRLRERPISRSTISISRPFGIVALEHTVSHSRDRGRPAAHRRRSRQPRLRSPPGVPADDAEAARERFRDAPSVNAALSIARTLRDVAGASSSRDEPPSCPDSLCREMPVASDIASGGIEILFDERRHRLPARTSDGAATGRFVNDRSM